MCISVYLLQGLIPQREAVTQKANLGLEGDTTFKDFLKIKVRAGVGRCDQEHLP